MARGGRSAEASRSDVSLSDIGFYIDWLNICNLLRSRRRGLQKIKDVASELSHGPAWETPAERQTVDVKRTSPRVPVLLLGLWLMQNWPTRLGQLLSTANISRSRCYKAAKNWSRSTTACLLG